MEFRKTLTNSLYELMKQREYCDLMLSVKGHEFFCHKVVIAAACPVLKNIISQSTDHIRENELFCISMDFATAEAVEILLKYFYTGETPSDQDTGVITFFELKRYLCDPDSKAATLNEVKEALLHEFTEDDDSTANHSPVSSMKTTAIVEVENEEEIRNFMKVLKQQSKTRNRLILPRKPPFLCPCESCGKIFETRERLRSHYRHNHGEKKFKCSECPLRFLYPKDLTTHLRTHTGEKPFVCDTCGKGFAQMGSMLTHSKIHSRAKSGNSSLYPCFECKKKYSQKELKSLDTEMAISEDYSTTLTCPNENCAKKFASMQTLRKHIKNAICKVDKPSCAKCKTKFVTPQQLRRHIAQVHCNHARTPRKNGGDQDTTNKESTGSSGPDAGYHCTLCGRFFDDLAELGRHVTTCEATNLTDSSHTVDPLVEFEHNHNLLELCSEVVMDDDMGG